MELILSIVGEVLGSLLWMLIEVLFTVLGDALAFAVRWLFEWWATPGSALPPPEGLPESRRAEPAASVRARVAAVVDRRPDWSTGWIARTVLSAAVGGLAGWASLVVMPRHLVHDPVMALITVPAAAVVAGVAVPMLADLFGRDRGTATAGERFAAPFVLAFAYGLVRWWLGR